MKNDGFNKEGGHVNINIVRSMIDSKMAVKLSGAGRASCQLCTTTHRA